MARSRIAGTGRHLPEKVLTNFDLEKMVDTTDEWIRTRTGIEKRHIAADGETTVDLAEPAARAAMQAAGVTAKDIDFIVFGTVALASFSSGALLNASGWSALNWIVLPACAVILVPLLLSLRRSPESQAAA